MNNCGFSENMAPLKSYKFKKIDSEFNGEYLPLCAKVSSYIFVSIISLVYPPP